MQAKQPGPSKTNSIADLGRILRACVYTARGLRFAWRNEAAFRQEVLVAMVLVPGAFFVGTDAVERLLLIGAVLMVLITELLNTAVEVVVDRFGGEVNTLSGAAKDLASAAVFISLLLAAAVWATFLLQRFY